MLKRDALFIFSFLLFSILAPSVFAQADLSGGIGNIASAFTNFIDLYDGAPYFFDFVLLLILILTVIQAGLKTGAKSFDKKSVNIISTVFALIASLVIVFAMRANNLTLLDSTGPIGSTILVAVIVIGLLMIVFAKVPEKHRWTVAFFAIFIIHFLALNYLSWYGPLLEANPNVSTIVSIIVMISLIFVIFSIIGLFFKAFHKGSTAIQASKTKTSEEMETERKYTAQKEERSARTAERTATRALRREASKISEAKNILGEIIHILAGGTVLNKTNLRKRTGRLKRLSVAIGGYVGIASNLATKIERFESVKDKYSAKLVVISNKLLALEHEVNNNIGELVEACKQTDIDAAEAKRLSLLLDNEFSKVLQWSEGLLALEREIYEDLEKERNT